LCSLASAHEMAHRETRHRHARTARTAHAEAAQHQWGAAKSPQAKVKPAKVANVAPTVSTPDIHAVQ
jgi:hypothetical protein